MMNIEYINKITQKYIFLLYLCFIIFISFIFVHIEMGWCS